MAVKTILKEEDVERMLGSYAIGSLIELRPIEKGTVQTNYFLRTETGKYILRLYENRSFAEVIFENEVIDALWQQKFPCPERILPIKDVFFEEKPVNIFRFSEGREVEEQNERQKENVIRLMAKLHQLTAGKVFANADQRLTYTPEGIDQILKKKLESLPGEYHDKYVWWKEELDQLELPETLVRSVCHCDYHYSNILFRGDEVEALIDFDDANDTYRCFDILSFSNLFVKGFDHESWADWKADEIVDFREVKDHLKIYESIQPLSQDEKEHMYDLAVFVILIDCVWFFERGLTEFYEKKKIDALKKIGRNGFRYLLFTE